MAFTNSSARQRERERDRQTELRNVVIQDVTHDFLLVVCSKLVTTSLSSTISDILPLLHVPDKHDITRR